IAGPGVTAIEPIEPAGKVNVHWRAAGRLPAVEVNTRSIAMGEPAGPVPVDRTSEDWARKTAPPSSKVEAVIRPRMVLRFIVAPIPDHEGIREHPWRGRVEAAKGHIG